MLLLISDSFKFLVELGFALDTIWPVAHFAAATIQRGITAFTSLKMHRIARCLLPLMLRADAARMMMIWQVWMLLFSISM